MTTLRKAFILFFLLIFLAFLSWYYVSSSPVYKSTPTTANQQSDLTIHQLSLKRFDQKGELVQWIRSPTVEHIPFKNEHLIQKPLIYLKEKNKSTIQITAEKAIALRNGQQITLLKRVEVRQEKPANRLTTEKLIYLPQQKIAKTDLPVTLFQPGSRIHAVGMVAYLGKEQMIQLTKANATVEGRHARKQV